MSVKIKFKKLREDSQLPKRMTPGAGGFDMYSTERKDLTPGNSVVFDSGIAMAIPEGYVGIISPRSGLASTKIIKPGARIIDSDFRGEVKINLHNHGKDTLEICVGDRVAQLVVVKGLTDWEEVDELDETERGSGGFGHTGV